MAHKTAATTRRREDAAKTAIYTLEVRLLGNPAAGRLADNNSAASCTIQVRGDQVLADLHQAILETFDHGEEYSYEFHLGHKPTDPAGPRYVLPAVYDVSVEDGAPAAGRVDQATLASLGLEVGRRFGYLSDSGDDWWYEIRVADIHERLPRGKYPKVTKHPGKDGSADAPAAPGEAPGKEEGPQPLTGRSAADAACLVGELHLSQGEYARAVEAFSRAIDISPTADAYEGRAKAYRGLAAADERTAQGLR
jgi:tetratricopeptide (TPR) repeat protein